MDKWDNFAADLNKIENLNQFSVTAFWKTRLQEETELYGRKIQFLNEEITLIKEMLDRYKTDLQQTYERLTSTEKRFDYERNVLGIFLYMLHSFVPAAHIINIYPLILKYNFKHFSNLFIIIHNE